MSLLFDDVEFNPASPPSSGTRGEGGRVVRAVPEARDFADREAWERGSVFLDRFLRWCAGVAVEDVPLDLAVSMISKLSSMKNAVDGLRLGLAAHVDSLSNPPPPTPDPGSSPLSREKPLSRAHPLPGDHSDLTGLLQASGGQSRDRARDEVRRAQTIRDTYPMFGREIRHGALSSAYVDVLSRQIPLDLIEQSQADESLLLGHAMQESVEQFTKTVRAWVFQHAPERAERKARQASHAEKFSIFPSDGGYRLAGWLSAINGLDLDKTVRAMVGVPSEGDRRSHAERNADALVAFLRGEDPSAVHTGSGGRTGTAGESADEAGHGRRGPGTEENCVGTEPNGRGAEQRRQDSEQQRKRGEQRGQEDRQSDGRHARSGSRRAPRTHILVHVPLATLVQTEKAIESGCSQLRRGGSYGSRKDQREDSPPSDQQHSPPHSRQDHSPPLEGRDHSPPHGLSARTADSLPTGNLVAEPENGPPRAQWADPVRQPGQAELADQRCHTEAPATCYTTGAGLGRRGACLGDRQETSEYLGGVLAQIRAGINSSMLTGFAPAKLEDGTVLAPSELAAMLCDSRLSRVVLTAHGEPLDASHAQRTFSIAQTRAVLARDRTCRYPGCDRGMEVGEIHHAQEWNEGGATVLDNAVLLCYRHHKAVHSNSITITHHVGGFVFSRPDHTVLGTRVHESNTFWEAE